MVEDERQERRIVRAMFGTDARLIETGPAPGKNGSVAIDVDGRRLGSGRTFRAALTAAWLSIPEGDGEKIGCETRPRTNERPAG
jgi:hypothetical protein